MFGWKFFAGTAFIFVGSTLSAQTGARATDPVFTRAQALVSDGNGAAGRALIDSMIKATPPSAPLYPQALFWRASLAASAADAESDYKHIVVDYPLTPQAPDALLRLAQLELARGDRDAALGHLQRIPRDYPSSKSLARANYWIARVFFEKNDLVNGCAANASALARLDSTEVELRNQIQYQGQRCPLPSAPIVAAPSQPATLTPSPATQSEPARQSQPVTTSADSLAVTKPTPTSVEPRPSAVEAKPVETKRPAPAEANDAKPSIVDPTKSPAPSKPVSAPPAIAAKSTTTAKPEYSVQVAAYKTRSDADKLTESLKNRGYEARVDVSPDWFRVRVGRYATEGAAESKLREMKAKQLAGFVVRAPDR
jgi:cell division septation protein DedD